MWKLKEIEINNLFSHKHTKYSFKQNETSVLIGENKDKSGANSNGSGKSTLVEAITLAFTGDTYRGVTKDRFIRRGEKTASVELKLYNLVLNETFDIKRTFYNSSSSTKILLSENGEEITKITNPNLANKYINDKIGISNEDLLDYFVIGQGNNTSFFSVGDAKQKQIISRFCNYKEIDKICETLTDEITELNKERSDLVEQSISLNSSIKSLREQLDNLEQDSDIQDKINAIKQKKIKIKEEIEEKRESLDVLMSQIDAGKKLIDSIKIDDTAEQEIKLKFAEINSELEVLDDKIRLNSREYNKYSNLLGKEMKCPKCQSAFIPESEFSVEEVESLMEGLKKSNTKLKAKYELLQNTQLGFEEEIQELKDSKRKLKQAVQSVEGLEQTLSSTEDLIELLSNRYAALNENIKELKNSDVNAAFAERLTSDIKLKENKLGQINKQREKSVENIEYKQKLLYNFSKTGFKTYLANLSIKHIENIANEFLSKFDTNLQVQINGFKLLKNGELRDKIDILILEDGIHEGVYKQYSGGEKGRVELCGILTIHSLINNSCEYGKGLDFVCIDENIDGLDVSGQIEIIKILVKSCITSLVTMHHVENLQLPNRVLFVKHNKITTIEAS